VIAAKDNNDRAEHWNNRQIIRICLIHPLTRDAYLHAAVLFRITLHLSNHRLKQYDIKQGQCHMLV